MTSFISGTMYTGLLYCCQQILNYLQFIQLPQIWHIMCAIYITMQQCNNSLLQSSVWIPQYVIISSLLLTQKEQHQQSPQLCLKLIYNRYIMILIAVLSKMFMCEIISWKKIDVHLYNCPFGLQEFYCEWDWALLLK